MRMLPSPEDVRALLGGGGDGFGSAEVREGCGWGVGGGRCSHSSSRGSGGLQSEGPCLWRLHLYLRVCVSVLRAPLLSHACMSVGEPLCCHMSV